VDALLVALLGVSLLGGCSPPAPQLRARPANAAPAATSAPTFPPKTEGGLAARDPLPGMPTPLDMHDLYAADRPGLLSPVVAAMTPRIWVPNSGSHTVSVIDPATYKVIQTIDVGANPQHVVPSWDLKTLWVNNDKGNSLTPIDPATGAVGARVAVHDPYNLYFTPDGRYAVVMASKDHELVFRDPHTMDVRKIVHAPCDGVNHADYSADGRYMIISCEFSGELLKVDVARRSVVGVLGLPGGGKPQDVKISPDGRTWYVADMDRNGLWVLDGDNFKVLRFLPTGRGTHGLYVSRDSRHLYITNRGEGSISLLAFDSGKLTAKWRLPHGGSPDMGGLSTDGKILWLSGRYNGEVYAIDTGDGHLIHTIAVGSAPHGLCVYPQPGRYSLGHTGILR
jgi:YVTN family beta-propeller protein